VSPAALREFRRCCCAAIRSAVAGDDARAGRNLSEAREWLSARSVGPCVAVQAMVRRALDESPLWTDEELAMVARCSLDEARAARAVVEGAR